jgi:hypothetical protein
MLEVVAMIPGARRKPAQLLLWCGDDAALRLDGLAVCCFAGLDY